MYFNPLFFNATFLNMLFFRANFIACLTIITAACTVNKGESQSATQSVANNIDKKIDKKERWFNPGIFENINISEGSLNTITFNIPFDGIDGKEVILKRCSEALTLSENQLAEMEYTRWQWLRDNCTAAEVFFLSPDTAKSLWPKNFDYDLIRSFPAVAIPYFHRDGLEGRVGTLGKFDSSLTFSKAANENSIEVEVDGMVVTYEQLARADFNRDGYQDIFVRMSWYIKEASGSGVSWIVLTQRPSDASPMMLWRK